MATGISGIYSLAEIADLSPYELTPGIIQEIYKVCELLYAVKWIPVEGRAYEPNREVLQGGGGFIDRGEVPASDSTTATPVVFLLRELAADIIILNKDLNTAQNKNDLLAQNILGRTRRLTSIFTDSLINGTDTARSLNGLANQITGDQVIDPGGTDGNTLTAKMLMRLRHQVKTGRNVAFLASAAGLREILGLQTGASGTPATELREDIFGLRVSVPTFAGVPIFWLDDIGDDETKGANTNLTSIYCVDLDPFSGVIFGYPSNNAPGIKTEYAGILDGYSAKRWLMTWECLVAMKSTQSGARLQYVISDLTEAGS